MEKLILSIDFGHDSKHLFTIEPQAKVNLVLQRSEFLLNAVNKLKFPFNCKEVQLDISLSSCNRNFILGYFMKNLIARDSEVIMCRERKASFLKCAIMFFKLERDFVKLLLPRKVDQNNLNAFFSIWQDVEYQDIVNQKYLIDVFAGKNVGISSLDEFERLLEEVKTCHEEYLVYHLPFCICNICCNYRHNRGLQMWEGTYPTPYFGPITISPFPKSKTVGLTPGRPG